MTDKTTKRNISMKNVYCEAIFETTDGSFRSLIVGPAH